MCRGVRSVVSIPPIRTQIIRSNGGLEGPPIGENIDINIQDCRNSQSLELELL